MDRAHEFGGFDVDRVLIAEGPFLDAEDEAEQLDMARQFRKREGPAFARVAVHQLEILEIAQELPARLVGIADRVEIFARLNSGERQVPAGAFLLNQQHLRPKQIDEAVTVVELTDEFLVACDAPALDAEDFEELIVEGLRFALLIMGIAPFFGKAVCANADFIPGQTHSNPPQCNDQCGWLGANWQGIWLLARRSKYHSAAASPTPLETASSALPA